MSEHAPSSSQIDRTSTLDSVRDVYDHAIQLVDTTQPGEAIQNRPGAGEDSSQRRLMRNVTRTSLRHSMNRRKYAKWSAERFSSKDGDASPVEDVVEDTGSEIQPSGSRQSDLQPRASQVQDFASQEEGIESETEDTTRITKQKREKRKKLIKKERNEKESAIDVLYENQRGWFFCGIPLYSHSSLLQFDPAAWVTKDYKDSAVNITNAQVPDPSWQWDWKHWYVDMSNDVDEDGWQYSFAFFGNFSWHGNHPWFHSYVRRRRWLRRRVRREIKNPSKAVPSSMSAAHKLNTDYFTIHSQPRASTILDEELRASRPESYVSYRSHLTLQDEIPEEISDISSLLKALRLSSIDREKLDAIKKFVDSGGEELVYLKEYMHEIASLLVYQNSKRQLLHFLQLKAKEAQDHRDEHDADDRPEGEAESRRIDNLLRAAEATNEQIGGLEYYSDRKHVLKVKDDKEVGLPTPLKTIFDNPAPSPKLDPKPAGEIKGISDEAEVGLDGTEVIVQRVHNLNGSSETEDKGKGKEKQEHQLEFRSINAETDSPPRLKVDEVFIPDE